MKNLKDLTFLGFSNGSYDIIFLLKNYVWWVNMVKYLLFSLYFFTFPFYVNLQQGNILLSMSVFISFVCFIILLCQSILHVNNILISKNEFVLFILMGLYMVYTFVVGCLYGIQNLSIIKVLYNNVFVLVFMMLLLFHRQYKETFIFIRNMVCYSAVFVGFIGILLYLKDISVIRFSLHFPFLFLLDQASFNSTVGNIGEYRYQYTFTHKVRFGYFCLVMIFLFLKNNLISNKIRILGILLMLINIMIGNTATSFVAAIILLAYFVRKLKMNKYLVIFINMLAFITFMAVMVVAYMYIAKERNILTLGFRLPIWEGVIGEIKKNPFGYIDAYTFHNFTYSKVPYVIGSAHNVFLQETMDYGIIGGIIFLFIYLQYFYSLNTDRMVIFFATTLIFMVDIVLGKEGFSLFLLTYFLLDIEEEKNKIISIKVNKNLKKKRFQILIGKKVLVLRKKAV